MKVGSIMTRHNGTDIAVADVYDSKLIVQSSPVEFADSDTVVLFRADDYGVFNEECGNSFEIKNSQHSTVETHDYQSADIHFIRVSDTSRVWITLDFTELFTAAIADNTGYSIDGIFFYPQNKYNRYQRLFELSYYPVNVKSYGGSAELQVAASYATNATTTISIDNSIFAQPFHLAFVHCAGTIKVYFNGVLKLTKSAGTRNNGKNILTVGNTNLNTATSDISCAFLRVSLGQRWTANFTPDFSSVVRGFNKPYCLAFQHNDKTYYAPLTSTHTPPCLAVRHNNFTYYSIKERL